MSNLEQFRAKIAVVGAGLWSQGWHLPQLHSQANVKIVAIVEMCQHPRSTLVKKLLSVDELKVVYAAPVFSSIDDLLASGLDLDGVIVATNHASHADIAMKVMDAKLHVLCEKPMTTYVEEAKLLIEASASNLGKVFLVNNSANYRPKAAYIHDQISKGRLGEIHHVSSYFHTPLEWLFEDPANVGWVQPVGNMVGYGFCWGQMSHTLAWVYKMTSLTPVKVHAFLTCSERTGADVVASINVFCSNGATISISGLANVPGDRKHIGNTIVGSKGVLRYSGSAHGKEPDEGRMEWMMKDGQGANEVIEGFESENLNTNTGTDGTEGVDGTEGEGVLWPESVLSFIDACLGKDLQYIGADATVGFKAVATIDAIYRSARSGMVEEIV
jgi:predicted dehydrogenase